jgi:Tfp pilus assembly protein PilF
MDRAERRRASRGYRPSGRDKARRYSKILLAIASLCVIGFFTYQRYYPRRTTTPEEKDPARIHANLGVDYLDQKRYEEAEAELKKAIAIHEEADFYSNLADVYILQNKLAAARSACESALRLSPGDPVTLVYAAYIDILSGQADRAVVTLTGLLGRGGMSKKLQTEARKRLAQAYTDLGQFEQARGELESLLKEDPTDASLWQNLGRIYYSLGQPEKTLEAWKKSQEIEPANASLALGIATLEKKLQQGTAVPTEDGRTENEN